MQKIHGDWIDEEVTRCDKIIRMQVPKSVDMIWGRLSFVFHPIITSNILFIHKLNKNVIAYWNAAMHNSWGNSL